MLHPELMTLGMMHLPEEEMALSLSPWLSVINKFFQ